MTTLEMATIGISSDNESAFAEQLEAEYIRLFAVDPEYARLREPTVIIGNLGNTNLPGITPEKLALKMMGAILNNSYHLASSKAIKATCRHFKIPASKKAIAEFLSK